MDPKPSKHTLSRRRLLGWTARGTVGLAGAAVVALLARRGQLRATQAECVGNGHCRGCQKLADCKLPQGVFQRRATDAPKEARDG